MALLVPDQKLRKTFSIERRPLMLKDYLIDDLTSCSSNGFKSFPRRQCCTTIRFLLDIDLKTRDSNTTASTTKRLLPRSRSKAASTTISALQKASVSVLSAVKLLPFPSLKSPSPSPSVQRRDKKALLPISFLRKLLKRSFWRKTDRHKEEHAQDAIKPLKSFGEFLGEQPQPSDQNNLQSPTTSSTPNRVSVSCSSKSNSNSWTESDFTDNTLRSSSGNSESSSGNDAVEGRKHVQSSASVSIQVGVSVGEGSINCSESEENTKERGNEEEKEQCSPVSVLDCPFEDDQTDIASPFHQRLARMEGTRQKLMQNLRRFESLARLEPVDLEKRIASSEFEEDDDPVETPLQSDEENETETKAEWLLKQIKSTTASNNMSLLSNADNLLSDFFRETIEENRDDKNVNGADTLKAAEDWIYGKTEQVFVRWEEGGGRKAYLKDMEAANAWRWKNVEEEKHELGSALEIEVFTSLVNELVIDLF